MYKTLVDDKYRNDPDYPERMNRIRCYKMVLDGTIYDALEHAFTKERAQNGEYIPINKRRPSVRYNLCRLVVRDSASLLFGEGHWPTVDSSDPDTRDNIKTLIDETNLNATMLDATIKGSTGSVAIFMKVIKQRIFFSAETTEFLTPVWSPERPDQLQKIVKTYKVPAEELRRFGYTIPNVDGRYREYWFRIEFSDKGEIWFMPQTKEDKNAGKPPIVDDSRTTYHGLGFCPAVWIKNLPGGDDIDGACTFGSGAIDTQMEIEYQLSQGGRGLRYSSDPLLMVKEPPSADEATPIERTASSVLQIDSEGDAKLLEINGTAIAAVTDYVKFLREALLEGMRGTRASPDKLTAAQSGRAIELLYQTLIWLADDLRASYGKGGILQLIRMVVKAQEKIEGGLIVGEKKVASMKADGLSLKWPAWFEPTPQDRLNENQAIAAGRKAGIVSRELGVKHLASMYDNPDVTKELANIEKDIEQDDARQVKLKAVTNAGLTTEQ